MSHRKKWIAFLCGLRVASWTAGCAGGAKQGQSCTDDAAFSCEDADCADGLSCVGDDDAKTCEPDTSDIQPTRQPPASGNEPSSDASAPDNNCSEVPDLSCEANEVELQCDGNAVVPDGYECSAITADSTSVIYCCVPAMCDSRDCDAGDAASSDAAGDDEGDEHDL